MTPRFVVSGGPGEGATIEIPEGTGTIGRDESCAVRLENRSVSREHCRLDRSGDVVTVRDLGSRNGLFLGDARVDEVRLVHGDILRVGRAELLFLTREEPVLFAPAAPAGTVEIRPGSPEAARDARALRSLLAFASEVGAARSPDEIQRRLLDEVFAMTPSDRGVVVFADGPKRLAAGLALGRDGRTPQALRVSSTVVGRVLREGVAVMSADPVGEFRNALSLADAGSASLMAAPLTALGRAIGVLYATAPAACLAESHLRIVSALAGIAAAPLETARHVEWLEGENAALRSSDGPVLIGESAPMKAVERLVERVAPSDATVLITGESGTGKELVARRIHAQSRRASGPFVALNCAALAETLLESELFGHERGAFTGAVAQRKGRLEAAHGGTIFFDEVGEMSPALQAKLLRVLQERTFERVGGTRTIAVDVRVIAATNRDLERAVADGAFRKDLYYRLNVVAVPLRPLRERGEDALLLADHFARTYSVACKRRLAGLTDEARALLLAYDWPGNVRELANAIERAVVLGSSDRITAEDLPETVRLGARGDSEMPARYHDAMREARRRILSGALERCGGSYTKAAALLGLHRNNLHRMMRDLERTDRPGPPASGRGRTAP